MTYIEIQQEVIAKYNIRINEHSDCYGRMHAHVKERTICKWSPKNSKVSTFALFHEIGHIECYKPWMRRAEDEYYATKWAIERFAEYGLEVPQEFIFKFQRYIILEKYRGLRRGGKNYGTLNLYSLIGHPEIIEKDVLDMCDKKWRAFIGTY